MQQYLSTNLYSLTTSVNFLCNFKFFFTILQNCSKTIAWTTHKGTPYESWLHLQIPLTELLLKYCMSFIRKKWRLQLKKIGTFHFGKQNIVTKKTQKKNLNPLGTGMKRIQGTTIFVFLIFQSEYCETRIIKLNVI